MKPSLARFALGGVLVLVLVAAGCRRDNSQASGTAANPVVVVVTATPAPSAAEAAAPVVSADPMIASQRNAARRRSHRPADSAAVRGEPAERTGGTASISRAGAEVPAGTILRVAFDQTISSANSRPGDRIRGRLLDDLLDDDGRVAAPAGTRVEGRIENAAASGRLSGTAQLAFRLTDLFAGGRDIPISSSVYRNEGESHTRHDAEYIAGGAAVGALVGQLVGRDTQSTLKGAAAGAAAGTGVAAATGAQNIEIQAGRTVAFTLEQPLRVR